MGERVEGGRGKALLLRLAPAVENEAEIGERDKEDDQLVDRVSVSDAIGLMVGVWGVWGSGARG